MKILMFVSVYFPSTMYGGPATVAKMQAEELVKRGNEVTIITTGVLSRKPFKQMTSEIIEENGVIIRYFKLNNKPKRFSYFYSEEMMSWLKANIYSFDLCHIHYGREINPILIASIFNKFNKPYVLQTHGMLNSNNIIKKTIDKFIVTKQLKNAENCLVLQEHEQKRIKSIQPKAKVKIMPNGIKVSDKIIWNSENLTKKNILFLARLHPRKKVLNFIRMAEILSYTDSNFQFRIVGPDGGELEEAKKLTEELNLSNVNFIGEISNMNTDEEYLDASVYVLPSFNEPFPMSVIEALKLGTPTIITNTTQNMDLLKSYDAVFITDGTPEELSNAVLKIINNQVLASKLSRNGNKLITECLNIEKVVEDLSKLYVEKTEVSEI